MEFAFTAGEQAFATEVRRFLRDHLPDRFPHDGMDAGYGSGAHSRAFLRALAAEGISGEKLFEVVFSDVEVRREDLLGPPGRGWEALVPSLAAGALARSAEMVGCAQRILNLAVDYARVRVQSGRPIGYCEEHPLHLFHKRIQAARLDFGDPGLHLETVAQAIGLA